MNYRFGKAPIFAGCGGGGVNCGDRRRLRMYPLSEDPHLGVSRTIHRDGDSEIYG